MIRIILLLVLLLSGASIGHTQPRGPVELTELSIRQAWALQTYRYAREMYRAGRYDEAGLAFRQILLRDCSNPTAQYYLRQTIKKDPRLTALGNVLDQPECPKYDFDETDFLPASLYYEADADILKEQISVYNRTYRQAKAAFLEAAAEISALKCPTPAKPGPCGDTVTPSNLTERLHALQARLTRVLETLEDNQIRLEALERNLRENK